MQSYPRSFRRSLLVLGAVLAAAYATGCGGTTHVATPPAPTGLLVFQEIEPNDRPDFPDFVAVLDRSSYVAVQGSVEAFGFDLVDHIEFQSSEPMELDFYLTPLTPFGDVDVSIYDPLTGQTLSTYALNGAESGTIVVHQAGRPFQFVIEAYASNSEWDLEIVGFPYFGRSAGESGGLEAGPAEAPRDSSLAPALSTNGTQSAPATERPWIEFISS